MPCIYAISPKYLLTRLFEALGYMKIRICQILDIAGKLSKMASAEMVPDLIWAPYFVGHENAI